MTTTPAQPQTPQPFFQSPPGALQTVQPPPRPNSRPSMPETDLSALRKLLFNDAREISEAIKPFLFDGAASILQKRVVTQPAFDENGTAGFNFSILGAPAASLRFGQAENGDFCLYCVEGTPNPIQCRAQYFSASGNLLEIRNEEPTWATPAKPLITMDPLCPIANWIYNHLALEYEGAESGSANTARIRTLENFLRDLESGLRKQLSVYQHMRDPAIEMIRQQVVELELDRVLSWNERRKTFEAHWANQSLILKTKARAHRLPFFAYGIQGLVSNARGFGKRWLHRPFSNSLGLLLRFTVDPVRWFFRVVRGNMGYSIAMAIYSPFTFFFITQPMNPHAMWAVGNVRSAYINTTDCIKSLLGLTALPATASAQSYASTSGSTVTTGTGGATNTFNKGSLAPLAAAAVGTTAITNMQTKSNILLSTDVPAVDGQSWDDRMGRFKDMQIGYEGGMEFAPRFGRLEQMETQLNWPLIVEGAWEEMERYLTQIADAEKRRDLPEDLAAFFKAEQLRTHQLELYLWDRNVRFILDHPYSMMDESHDQTSIDYYVGRTFINLQRMTDVLTQRFPNLKMPGQYGKIADLAQKYKNSYHAQGDMFDRLKANSSVFSQRDRYNTKELRNTMRREWEILYLLSNKAQEASNAGLQMYIWSVRNAVYVLQSVHSAKREELRLLLGGMDAKSATALDSATFQRIDHQLEALFHMLVLEYTSIRYELSEKLTNDIESVQRKKVIENIESYLKDRETLLKSRNLI